MTPIDTTEKLTSRKVSENIVNALLPNEKFEYFKAHAEAIQVEIDKLADQERQRAVEEKREELLENQVSLEQAVKDSLKHGGVNSFGYGYDSGYLDCFNQVITLLSPATVKGSNG